MNRTIRNRTLLLAGLTASFAATASADIIWTGAVDNDIFNESNWDLTGSTVTVIDPSVAIMDNVVIANTTQPVEVPSIGGGQFRFQVGEGFMMTVDNAALICLGDDAIGSDPGTGIGITVNVINGSSFEPFFVTNGCSVMVDATSQIIFGGAGNPVNVSTVNLTFGASLAFIQEDPTEFTNEHLSKITVDGVAATVGTNITLASDGATGSIITVLQQGLGVSYCTAAINSTMVPATISATGFAQASLNDLTIECSDMPLSAFGFFIVSQSQGFVSMPGGSDGNLCVSGAVGRFVGPGQIQNSGTMGSIDLDVNLTSLPQPMGPVSVMAGDTWNFQCWFRDAGLSGMGTSNFSNGLEITFS